MGATGAIGRMIADRLEAQGHAVRRLSRSAGVDALTGKGLTEALAGAEVVIDALNCMEIRRKPAVDYFTRTSTALQQAAHEAGVRRIVVVSIAGTEDPQVARGYGYYAGKGAQQQVHRDGPVPATIVLSTQWFTLIPMLLERTGRGPIAVPARMLMAPVDPRAVVELVCAEAVADATGERSIAIRGPQTMTAGQAARRWMLAEGSVDGQRPRLLLEPPYFGRAIASGSLIPTDGITDATTLETWLRER